MAAQPMRILAGPMSRNWSTVIPTVISQGLVTFCHNNADIVYDYGSATFADILAKLPPGWEPDAILLWNPEYQGIPVGLEDSPYPIVAAVSDWNMGFHALKGMAPTFDHIFTDRPGVDVFRKAGFPNVSYVPLYGYDPTIHIRLPEIEPVYDVAFVGNLNHQVQRERSRWLARLAALGDRYRVKIVTGVIGADYARVLNQSRICFNRSIRGEMNMRAYEVPACGSLLFYEEENEEIRNVLADREQCVLYNENNLEELLEYYLTHEDERRQIAEAGHARVQPYSYDAQFVRLVQRIERLDLPRRRLEPRPFVLMPTSVQRSSRAAQAMRSVTPNGLVLAEQQLKVAVVADPTSPSAQSNLGVIYAIYAQLLQDRPLKERFQAQALGYLDEAIRLAPGQPVVAAYRGDLLWDLDRKDEALQSYLLAIQGLDQCSQREFEQFHFLHRGYDTFRVEYERAAWKWADQPDRYAAQVRDLFAWRINDRLGSIYEERHDYARAETAYRQAVAALPLGSVRLHLAGVLEKQGRLDEAIDQLKTAVVDEPFAFEAHVDLARLLYLSERFDECILVSRTAALLAQSCEVYRENIPAFRRWESAAWASVRPLAADQQVVLGIDSASGTEPKAASETDALRRLAAALLDKGQQDLLRGDNHAAATAFAEIIELCPNDPMGYAVLGPTLTALGKARDAVHVLQRAINISPSTPALHRQIGVALHKCGELEKAEKAFKNAASLDPMELDSRMNLAGMYGRQRQQALSEQIVAEVLDIDPDHPDGLAMLARLRLDGREYAGAQLLRDRLRRVCPEHPEMGSIRRALRDTRLPSNRGSRYRSRSRVAFVHSYLPFGGVENHIYHLCRSLDRDRHDIEVVVFADGPLRPHIEATGIPVTIIPVRDANGKIDPEKRSVLRDKLAEFDVVHSWYGGGSPLIGSQLAHEAGVPVQVQSLAWLVPPVEEYLDAVIVETDTLFRKLKSSGVRQRLVRINSGIDLDRFDPTRVQPAVHCDGPVVGRVSQLIKLKDPEGFVLAAGLVQRNHPEVNFLVVGEGPERESLEQLARQIGARVDFYGSTLDVPALLASMDIFAYPTLGDSYGFVNVEAMAMGKPVISTRIGAIPEIVRDGETGLIVEPGDPAGLAEAICRLVENTSLARRLGQQARSFVRRRYDFKREVRQVEELYAELLYQKKRSSAAASAGAHGASSTPRAAAPQVSAPRLNGKHPDSRPAPIHGESGRPASQEVDSEITLEQLLAAGEVALERGDMASALTEYGLAAQLCPQLAAPHSAAGSTLMAMGRPKDAVPYLHQAASLVPTAAPVQNQLGVALYQAGDAVGAEAAFLKAREADPADISPLLNLVDLYRSQERFEEAGSTVKEALMRDSANPDVLVSFGALCLELGDADGAALALRRLQRVKPDHEAVALLLRALAAGDETEEQE